MTDRRGESDATWVAEQIALHRLQQNDVADVLGINASGVTRLLKGQRRLREDELALLRDFFGRFKPDNAKVVPPRLISVLSFQDVQLDKLSERTGMPASRLLEIKYGNGPEPDLAERTRLGAAFGLDADYLFAPTPLPAGAARMIRSAWRGLKHSPAPHDEPDAPSTPQLPIYRPKTWLSGELYGADLELVERREPPTKLKSAVGAYGLYMTVRTFEPLVLPGDVAWIHPGAPLVAGTRAVLWKDAELIFGWFIQETSKKLTFFAALERPRGDLDGTTFGEAIELTSASKVHAVVAIEAR